MQNFCLYLIVGPSGTGKTTVFNHLVERGVFLPAISHSTRPMRTGEREGSPYYFVDFATFDKMAEADLFIQQVTYNNNKYGFSKVEITDTLKQGNVGAIVEAKGVKQLKALFPGQVKTIFFYPPPAEKLRQRMLDRQDKLEDIEARLALLQQDLEAKYLADWAVNTDCSIEEVVDKVTDFILQVQKGVNL